jgi:hypothetical protein
MNPNFESMTQSELRASVVANRQDDEAFHLWADRATANAPKTIYPPVSLEEERIIHLDLNDEGKGNGKIIHTRTLWVSAGWHPPSTEASIGKNSI